jgi:AcrR family transcriptional regulator
VPAGRGYRPSISLIGMNGVSERFEESIMSPNITSLVEDQVLVQKRRAQIVKAATTLFSSQGFYRTTMKEIAKLAGMSSGLIYQYVREKDDVLLLVLLEVLEAYSREIPRALVGIEDPLARLIASVSSYCRVVDDHRAATVLAYRSTKSLAPEKREIIQATETATNQHITREIVACIKTGRLRKVNADVLTYQFVTVAHAWALKGWFLKSIVDIDSYIEQTIDMIFVGVLTPSGERQFEKLRKNLEVEPDVPPGK